MKYKITAISAICLLGLGFTQLGNAGTSPANQSNHAIEVKKSKFVQSHTPGDFVLETSDDVWPWGMAPIYDEDGKLHIFNSIIPHKGTWKKNSKIVHWVADSIEGPFTLRGDLFSSQIACYHNPQVAKVGDTYVLVYMLVDIENKKTKDCKLEVGIATAKSLYGPWTESPYNPVVPASGMMDGREITHASNPTFVEDPGGKYRIYYKSRTRLPSGEESYREYSFAVSDHLEGPYVNYEGNPVLTYDEHEVDFEDGYAFYYNGAYYMILEDRLGVVDLLEGKKISKSDVKAGGHRPGIIYKSEDGIDWGIPMIGYLTNTDYFGGKAARCERPHILWKDGKPEYLFISSHVRTSVAGFYVKINNWEGE